MDIAKQVNNQSCLQFSEFWQNTPEAQKKKEAFATRLNLLCGVENLFNAHNFYIPSKEIQDAVYVCANTKTLNDTQLIEIFERLIGKNRALQNNEILNHIIPTNCYTEKSNRPAIIFTKELFEEVDNLLSITEEHLPPDNLLNLIPVELGSLILQYAFFSVQKPIVDEFFKKSNLPTNFINSIKLSNPKNPNEANLIKFDIIEQIHKLFKPIENPKFLQQLHGLIISNNIDDLIQLQFVYKAQKDLESWNLFEYDDGRISDKYQLSNIQNFDELFSLRMQLSKTIKENKNSLSDIYFKIEEKTFILIHDELETNYFDRANQCEFQYQISHSLKYLSIAVIYFIKAAYVEKSQKRDHSIDKIIELCRTGVSKHKLHINLFLSEIYATDTTKTEFAKKHLDLALIDFENIFIDDSIIRILYPLINALKSYEHTLLENTPMKNKISIALENHIQKMDLKTLSYVLHDIHKSNLITEALIEDKIKTMLTNISLEDFCRFYKTQDNKPIIIFIEKYILRRLHLINELKALSFQKSKNSNKFFIESVIEDFDPICIDETNFNCFIKTILNTDFQKGPSLSILFKNLDKN